MKTIILIVCFAFQLSAQQYTWKDAGNAFKRSIIPASFAFVAGGSDGLNQTLIHHYDRFEAKFPNANPQYWNPKISWTNKYKNGDENQGPAYFGSRTFLVATTDAYHLTRAVNRASLVSAGLTLSLNFNSKRKLSHRLIDLGIGLGTSYIAHSIGFELVYGQIFR